MTHPRHGSGCEAEPDLIECHCCGAEVPADLINDDGFCNDCDDLLPDDDIEEMKP